MESPSKMSPSLPWHAWISGIIFLLFGLASTFDYVMSITQGESYYRASGMTEQQIAYFSAVPFWAVLAWTASVWASLLGAGTMLLRRRIAMPLFLISVAGSFFYILYSFALSTGREAMGMMWPMPLLVTALTIGMVFYCGWLIKKGVFWCKRCGRFHEGIWDSVSRVESMGRSSVFLIINIFIIGCTSQSKYESSAHEMLREEYPRSNYGFLKSWKPVGKSYEYQLSANETEKSLWMWHLV